MGGLRPDGTGKRRPGKTRGHISGLPYEDTKYLPVVNISGSCTSAQRHRDEFVLDQVGIDKDSGPIWRDYVGFVKSGPGTAGGSGWQDAQKMDLLRKAYQRAICVPMGAVEMLWKEYSAFEMDLNKMTVRLVHPLLGDLC